MTARQTSERLGERLPVLLEELGAPRVPDYFDDMLRTTAAMRQRPSWASLERWLPMGVLARPAPMGLPSWRPVFIVVALALALTVAGVLLSGARPTPVTTPFGPAANGALIAATSDGDIVRIDPATGDPSPFLVTPATESFPSFVHTGDALLYSVVNGEAETIYVAGVDGSNPRVLHEPAPGEHIAWVDDSADGSRLVVVSDTGGVRTAQVIDVASGRATPVSWPMTVEMADWRSADELVFTGRTVTDGAASWATYLYRLGDAQPRQVGPSADSDSAFHRPSLSPDGNTWVYSHWGDGTAGRLTALDLATGATRPIEITGPAGHNDLGPIVSPDGRSVLLARYVGNEWRLVVGPLAGGAPTATLGSARTDDATQASYGFSPDGTRVIARYPDGAAWIYDPTTGEGTQLVGTYEAVAWQRLPVAAP